MLLRPLGEQRQRDDPAAYQETANRLQPFLALYGDNALEPHWPVATMADSRPYSKKAARRRPSPKKRIALPDAKHSADPAPPVSRCRPRTGGGEDAMRAAGG